MSKPHLDPPQRGEAYAAAEERLLDILSPLAEHAGPYENASQAYEQEEEDNQSVVDQDVEESVDPAVDNMMHIITNDSDIHSLISSSDSVGFKGWEDSADYDDLVGDGQGHLIYGVCRNVLVNDQDDQANIPDTAGDQYVEYMDSTPSKRGHHLSNEIIEIDDSPETARESAMALFQAVANSQGMLTNGQDHHLVEEIEMVSHSQENGDLADGTECVIYDENMVVVTTEEHCCEIIVTTHGVANEQEMARAFLMGGNGITPGSIPASAMLNGRVYITEEETHVEMQTDGNDIYLSEAALGQSMMLQHQHHNNELVVAEEDVEDPTFVDDQPLEEERPDICQVYDHELEDHDDEEIEEEQIHEGQYQQEVGQFSMDWQMHQQQEQEQQQHGQEQQYEHEQQPILIASDVEEEVEEQQHPHMQQQPLHFPFKEQESERSSPTEFPVSSSSPPNGSDRDDDLDDDMAGHPSPAPRKYPPLLKNTLFAEAMDRRLAYICQTQPQMSLTEKVFAWDTAVAHDCEGVEDVENFQTAFEQLEPHKEHNFLTFRESLERNLKRIGRDIMHMNEEVSIPTPSKRVQERLKPQRRLLHHPIPAEDTIILDDDDEDCYEVTGGGKDKSSITTLIPEEELECEDPDTVEPEVKTTETQTAVNLVTKETSTTDLINCQGMMPPPAESGEVPEDQTLSTFQTGHKYCEMVRDVFQGVRHQQYMEQHKQFQQQQQQQQLQHQQQQQMQHYQEHHQQEFQQQQKLQHFQELQEHHHQQQQQHHFHQIPRHQQYQPQYVPEMPENPAMVTTNQTSASYGDYPNDAMFYEQQEFCNYLGLTELATANAVASAMRELANSTVARRSLRVRPQHQLDRMRNDVRGKHRRERQEKDKDKDKELNSNHHHPMTTISELSNDRNDNSAVPTASEVTLTMPNENSDEADKDEVEEEEEPTDQRQTTQSSTDMYDYYYQAQGDRSEGAGVKPIEQTAPSSNNNNPQTMESAFAKVYAAAPPTQLLEDMQRRLREAREAQPSIYIVQAMNNYATGKERKSTNSIETVTFGEINAPHPSLESTKPASLPPPQQPPRNSRRSKQKKKSGPAPRSKRTKSQYHHHVEAKVQSNAPIRRRRTTVGGGAAHNVRDLVTRSTTHMNSKLLRNRKINLLKTYALTDATGPNGKKKRLSGGGGGSTGMKQNKVTKAATKTTTTTTSPLKNASVEPQEKSTLPEQHRLQQQQSPVVAHPNSPKKSKNKTVVITEGSNVTTAGRLSVTPTKDKHVKSHKLNTRRCRAKSLPTALSNKEIDEPLQQDKQQQAQKEIQPMPDKLKSPILMDTHEFLTHHAAVHPPVWNDVARRYAHHIRQANRKAEADTEETGGSVYARLEKPPSIYEHPNQLNRRSPHPTEEPHFSRRRRQQAGTSHKQQQSDSGLYPFDINLTPPGGLLLLSEASSLLRNPLAGENGKVLYMYYELDQLIVLQERSITFWKYSQLFNVLSTPATTPTSDGPKTKSPQGDPKICDSDHSSMASQSQTTSGPHWVNLGRLRRTTNDIEIVAPFGNRLCVHNSTPVYIEMRCHSLDHHRREGKLMSLYVNVYYYCEEELRPKMHSVHLDAVNCEWNNVIYTSIAESRYFVMAHQAEMMMGKSKTGICKYSLTPTLDTLASIREFKQLRHELKHIECLTEDRLIGYGVSRITIWDHRSGDTLMNYDLNMPLGRNLGAMHFPSFEIDQSSILILYQYIQMPTKPSQLHVIACEISHATPSHRLLHVHSLPSPQFDHIVVSINTGDHLILKSMTDDEIWLSAADPRQLTYVAPQGQGIQRFYARQKSQVVELTPHSLTVDSIANHFMKLATKQQHMAMILQSVNSLPVSPSPV
ncbi:LOW QUALITY PROTEIN: uncharacterized protein [Drosophila tropicalis]|uniref:LOW QUALITY PROTEIN: uncharacterized protein n=1 Tax=Drosophila tropicalis TaxID=46794 RepID=UPI0035ABD35C